MAFTEWEDQVARFQVEDLLKKRRPGPGLRNKLDLGYSIRGNSITIYEVREVWNSPGKKRKSMIAKATFVRSKTEWKVFWQRSDLKWHQYDPCPSVPVLSEFLELIDEDRHGCFWG